MADTNGGGSRPKTGANRPTALLVAWLFVGVTLVGFAVSDALREGSGQAWLFLFGGLILLALVVRDWLAADGGEFARRSDNPSFLVLTLFALVVTLWALVERVLI